MTDFYVYVRDKYFPVYMKGRKEGRNQARKAIEKPCGLAHTDKDFCICIGYTDFSPYVKRRKEEIILVDYLLESQVSMYTLVLTF